MPRRTRVRIDGQPAQITSFKGDKIAFLKVKGIKNRVKLPVAMLAAPKGFSKKTSAQMKKIIAKPRMGFKKKQRVKVSSESPLFS